MSTGSPALRFVDYFAVVAFDETEEKRNGQSVGRVEQRFPETDWDDVPFIKNLELFCQPGGWSLQTVREKPRFFVSVLTDLQRDRHYAAVLAFSESRSGPQSHSEMDETDEDFLSPSNASQSTVYVPKCLVLVSRHPFTENFRNCLGTIYTVYIERMPIEIESLLASLFSLRVPRQGVILPKFSLGAGDRQMLQLSYSPSIPATQSTVAILFQQLGIYNVVCLFCSALTDKKIVFHSQSYTRLTQACHALSSLVYPLKNTHVYIPIVPTILMQVLHSPVPLMIGVHSKDKNHPEMSEVFDIILVDLDSGSVFIPESIAIPPIPEPFQTRLLTSLTLVLNKDLYSADNLFSNGLGKNGQTLPYLDKQIRACFIRLFADVLSDYRICLQIVRIYPTPFITFHKAAFLGLRGLQGDEFMNMLMGSMSFEAFISERGPPFRVCDLFDEVYSTIQSTLKEEGESREKLLENIQTLAEQLLHNEPTTESGNEAPAGQPFVTKVPQPSESSITSQTTPPFPTIDLSKVQSLFKEKLNESTGVGGEAGPAPREVPVLSTGRSPFTVGGANIRRLEVLRNCLRCIFENKIAESRKMLSAVLLSMKSQVVRVAFCLELHKNLHPHNRATLEPQQFDLVVKLMNCALQNDSDCDESGVAYSLLSLASTYCRRLTQGVHQFAYTCIQDHPVFQNSQFWEAAFFHDVSLQLRNLYGGSSDDGWQSLPSTKLPFGTGVTKDTWNLYEEPLALRIASEKMKRSERVPAETRTTLESEEEAILYSQAVHYTNLMVCLRVPMDASKLRRVNVQDLEQRSVRSVAESQGTSTSGNDGNSDDSSSESDVESGFLDMDFRTDDFRNGGDLGSGTVRWIYKFLDKVCSEAGMSMQKLKQLHQRIPGFVAIHIENLEQVYRESKRLPPIQKPKMLMPVFLPGEQMLQGYLRVFLLSDGRSGPLAPTEGTSLLPAEGALFLTNYRIIFKGNPCDPYICEQVVTRTMPVLAVTKEKRIGQQVVTGTEQTSHHLHDALQIRSATFQLLKIAFDEEVTADKVENFVNSLEQIRWPESVLEIYALSHDQPTSAGITVPGHAAKSKSLNKTLGKKLNKTLVRFGAGRPGKVVEETTSQLMAIESGRLSEDGTLKASDDSLLQSKGSSKRRERSKDRTYSKDYVRMGLCSKSEVAQTSPHHVSGTASLNFSPSPRNHPFRLSTANRVYGLCRSYPSLVIVPSKVNDDSLRKIAKGYKHFRFPVVSWSSLRGAFLIRGAGFNPKTLFGKMKKQTEGFSSAMAAVSGQEHLTIPAPGAMKSSAEQERYISCLASLSPSSVGLNRNSSHLMSSVGSLLSLDSLMMASFDSAGSAASTPEVRQRSAQHGGINVGISRTATNFVRSSAGKNSTIANSLLRPAHQRRLSASSTISQSQVKRTSTADLRLKDVEGAQTLTRASLYIFGEKSQSKAIKLDQRTQFIPVPYPTSREAKEALKKFLRVATPSNPTSEQDGHLRILEESGWFHIVRGLLRISSAAVDLVDIQNSSVAFCLEDGWDVTAQLVSLAQIMLDPEYRTIEGFKLLIEKEWLAFGHRFSHRGNHTQDSSSSGVAPIFLFFLDAVHQLHNQFPGAFEFNDFFLRFLAYHSAAGYYKTFVLDCEADRMEAGLLHTDKPRSRFDQFSADEPPPSYKMKESSPPPSASGSIWDGIEDRTRNSTLFYNFLYNSGNHGVLRPQFCIASMDMWGFYLEDPLTVGSLYDLEIAEKELLERQIEEENSKEIGGSSARKVIDLSYHSTDYALPSGFHNLISEIHALEKDLDFVPRRWSTVLDKARNSTLKREDCRERSQVSEWDRWINRALHKKATIELLIRSRASSRSVNRHSAANEGSMGGGSQHSFKKYISTAPEHCLVCDKILWGVMKPGLRCELCDYTCHEKCSQLATSNCGSQQINDRVSSSANAPLRNLPEETAEEFQSAAPNAEIRTHEGFLFKKGALLKGWKSRYFVLDSLKHQLRYFDTKEDIYCKGWIDLSEVTSVIMVQSSPTDGACFDVRTTRRVYNFMANSAKEAHEWIEKIQSCLGE